MANFIQFSAESADHTDIFLLIVIIWQLSLPCDDLIPLDRKFKCSCCNIVGTLWSIINVLFLHQSLKLVIVVENIKKYTYIIMMITNGFIATHHL